MKCEKCDYVSHDFYLECPACHRDMKQTRNKLGVYYLTPIADFEDFFSGGSTAPRATSQVVDDGIELEVDLDGTQGGDDEVEFSLDD